MVLEATITIECFFCGLTIAINGFSMVFGLATIAFNGFRWFWTIGQTMRWFRWIVVVYSIHPIYFAVVHCPRSYSMKCAIVYAHMAILLPMNFVSARPTTSFNSSQRWHPEFCASLECLFEPEAQTPINGNFVLIQKVLPLVVLERLKFK